MRQGAPFSIQGRQTKSSLLSQFIPATSVNLTSHPQANQMLESFSSKLNMHCNNPANQNRTAPPVSSQTGFFSQPVPTQSFQSVRASTSNSPNDNSSKT